MACAAGELVLRFLMGYFPADRILAKQKCFYRNQEKPRDLSQQAKESRRPGGPAPPNSIVIPHQLQPKPEILQDFVME
jgi:hypothetical protein